MLKSFHAQGFLLAEHAVYENLAQELLDGLERQRPQRWTIVCERKEDLLSIRTQIFSLLKKIQNERSSGAHNIEAWAGVSLYTPDTLVRNFALTLSHNSVEQLGSDAHKLLNSPFIDVVEQERLTRILLLQLGYAGSDVAPLAKQILTLSDTELPRDENFLSILLEVQQSAGTIKTLSDIPDISLRTICVAYQLLQKINAHFCRLQSFVRDYWVPFFSHQLRSVLEKEAGYENFVLPRRFLTEPLLWVAAPEYTRDEQQRDILSTYRPGNFQSHLIDALRQSLFDGRALLQNSQGFNQSQTWWARTIIPTEQLKPDSRSAGVQILGSQAALEFRIDSLEKESQGRIQFLLGDSDSKSWNINNSDGSGTHSLTPHDFAAHLQQLNSIQEQNTSSTPDFAEVTLSRGDPEWDNPAAKRVAELHQEFKKDWQRLERFVPLVQEALVRYELSPALRKQGISQDLLLHRFFDSDVFNVGQPGKSAQLPPALSLLPGLKIAEEFVVVGAPHSPTTPSFHLRILNAVFHTLRSKQVAIEPIASEQSYRGYWQSFLSRPQKITFLLKELQEHEDFPGYSKEWCRPPVLWQNISRPKTETSAFRAWLRDSSAIEDKQWPRLLENQTPHGSTRLAVTSFADYIECPLRHYWTKLHRNEPAELAPLRPDRLELGQRVHALAENFLRSLRHIALLEEDPLQQNHLWLNIFAAVEQNFLQSDTFLEVDADCWTDAFLKSLTECRLSDSQLLHIERMAHELKTFIFTPTPNAQGQYESSRTDVVLKNQLTRESVRRAMKKLVLCEIQMAGEQPPAKNETPQQRVRAAFLEQPVLFQINAAITLSGRIDRVDSHPAGDFIIDYKTSKVPKNDTELVLLPSQLNSTNKLSVQGAVYSLAWAQQQGENDFERTRGVRRFSLVRLKTLDLTRNPELGFEFDAPLQKSSETFEQLHAEYRRFADQLAKGLFPAEPLLKETCKSCALSAYCPTAERNAGGLL
jgi:hypothetical protein